MRFVIFYLKCLDRKLIGSKDISSLTLWNEFREKQGKTYSRVFCHKYYEIKSQKYLPRWSDFRSKRVLILFYTECKISSVGAEKQFFNSLIFKSYP